jgi:hypothetical protein
MSRFKVGDSVIAGGRRGVVSEVSGAEVTVKGRFRPGVTDAVFPVGEVTRLETLRSERAEDFPQVAEMVRRIVARFVPSARIQADAGDQTITDADTGFCLTPTMMERRSIGLVSEYLGWSLGRVVTVPGGMWEPECSDIEEISKHVNPHQASVALVKEMVGSRVERFIQRQQEDALRDEMTDDNIYLDLPS